MIARPRLLGLLLAALATLAGCQQHARETASSPTAVSPILAKSRRVALADAVAGLFADKAAGETRALVLLRDGRIVAERYAAENDPRTTQPGGSLSKCVTALLVGLLVADGRLALDAPAAVPAWQRPGDPRGAITLRMLLQMRSGLRHTELGENSDAAAMLRSKEHGDVAAYAEAEPLAARAGTRSNYSSADTAVLADVVTRTLSSDGDARTRRQAVADYLRTRLLTPAHLGSMVADFDARGMLVGATGMRATPRDWAGLGELLRSNGAVRGAQLLPRGWIAFMRAPSPADPEMGAQLWLNHRNGQGGSLLPGRAPSGVFACAGAGGQFVLVSPAQRATLVRMGGSGDGGSGALASHLATILRTLPGYAGR